MTDPKGDFISYLGQQGLKLTPQRMTVLEVLLRGGGHYSLEEMYNLVNEVDNTIGQATVYRTLKLLVEAGFADALTLHDGITRYELKYGQSHHDHLVCSECGESIEFHSKKLEREIQSIAKQHGFKETSHVVNIIGVCAACRKTSKHQ